MPLPDMSMRDRNGLLPGMLRCPRHGDYKPAPFPYHPGCPKCIYGEKDDQDAS